MNKAAFTSTITNSDTFTHQELLAIRKLVAKFHCGPFPIHYQWGVTDEGDRYVCLCLCDECRVTLTEEGRTYKVLVGYNHQIITGNDFDDVIEKFLRYRAN